MIAGLLGGALAGALAGALSRCVFGTVCRCPGCPFAGRGRPGHTGSPVYTAKSGAPDLEAQLAAMFETQGGM